MQNKLNISVADMSEMELIDFVKERWFMKLPVPIDAARRMLDLTHTWYWLHNKTTGRYSSLGAVNAEEIIHYNSLADCMKASIPDTEVKGLKIHYGVDSDGNHLFIYEPVVLYRTDPDVGDETPVALKPNPNGFLYITDNQRELLKISGADAQKLKDNYKEMIGWDDPRNAVFSFNAYKEDADTEAITFPWMEIRQLASDNNVSALRFAQCSELSGMVLSHYLMGVVVFPVYFNTSTTPGTGEYAGMALNVGALCPPKCNDNIMIASQFFKPGT